MRASNRLSGFQIAAWTGLGAVTGMVAGFALGEWIGGVNRGRLERLARRVRERPPRPAGDVTGARAARTALQADPSLSQFALDAVAIAPGVVEVRGWVGDRTLRAHAAQLARGAPGVNRVINRVRVRGEDDQPLPPRDLATDQTA